MAHYKCAKTNIEKYLKLSGSCLNSDAFPSASHNIPYDLSPHLVLLPIEPEYEGLLSGLDDSMRAVDEQARDQVGGAPLRQQVHD